MTGPGTGVDGRVALIVLALILVAGAVARMYLLEARTMGHIELYTPGIPLPTDISVPPPRMSIFKTLTGTLWEVHPPSWYLSMWGWTRVFGHDLIALRLPSVLFGAASVFMLYLVGTLERDRVTALLGAGLLALNGHHVFWSQTARPYAMTCLIGLVATFFLLKTVRSGRRIHLAPYLIFSAYGLSSLYYYWPLFATHVLWVLLRSDRDGKMPAGLVRWQLLVLILCTPLITLAVFQSRASYLGGGSLTQLFGYMGFGFLFEPDVDASIVVPGLIRYALTLASGFLLLAGLAAKGAKKGEALSDVRAPGYGWLAATAAFAFTAVMVSAAVYTPYGPNKAAKLYATGAAPLLVLLVAYLITDPASRVCRALDAAKERTGLGSLSLTTLLLVVPVLIVAVVSLRIPFFASRGMLLFTPYLILTLAGGVVVVARRAHRYYPLVLTLLIAPLAALHLYSVAYGMSRPGSPTDYSGLYESWAPRIEDSDLIFVQKHWVTSPIFYYLKEGRYNFVAKDYSAASGGDPGARVWVLSFEGLPVKDEIREALSGYDKVESVSAMRTEATLFARAGSDKVRALHRTAAAPAGGHGKGDTPPLSARLGGEGYGTFWEAAVDSRGDIIVTGYSTEYVPGNFPDARVIGTPKGENILLAKFTPAGRLLWMTIIGGTGNDYGLGLALDTSDNIYIAGMTSSLDLPTTPGAFDRTNNGGGTHCSGPHGCNLDGYVMKLAPDGASLVYSTYLGGSGEDAARGGVAVDEEGHAYVTGFTESRDFLEKGRSSSKPAKVNTFHGGTHDAFVAKISPDGSRVVYSRYIGGSKDDNEEVGMGVDVDGAGRAYVQAIVRSDDATTTPDAYGPLFRGGESDTYLARLSPDGTGPAYATFIGGSGSEFAEHGIKVDDDENVYITGYTNSGDFDRVNADQADYGGGGDGYLAKIGPDGRPVFSTFVGGRGGEDVTFGPALDQLGNVYVTGRTSSPDFEVTPGAFDRDFNGGVDSFLRVYGPDGGLLYSTFLGGSGDDNTRGITLDRGGNPIILGSTTSKDFPASSDAPSHEGADHGDGFMVIVDLNGSGLLQSLGGGSQPLRTKD